jgi:NAD(P)-dependent dehydrogenase (short-subunit alcohol dehydrogenase family)
MAVELAPHRIRVNSAGPTLVDTPLARASSIHRKSARTLKSGFPWAHWRASRT